MAATTSPTAFVIFGGGGDLTSNSTAGGPSDLPIYPAGTWGPEASHFLVARDGRVWVEPAALGDDEEEAAVSG